MYKIILYIKSFLAGGEKKQIFGNFFSLSVLQFSSYLIPIITLPYLTRVLGPEKFGLNAFAQAFVQYFILFTDFGFNLSATREISINRLNNEKVSKIFVAVTTIRLLFLAISTIIILIIISLVPKFSTDALLYLLWFFGVYGTAIFPQWFYQGIERMKFITIFSLSSKLLFTAAIFLFIQNENDYLYLPLLTSSGLFVAGVMGLLYPFLFLGVSLVKPNISEIKFHLKEGWHIFLSTLSINLYTTSNSVILGLLTNNVIVGYYTAAEKLFRGVQFIGMPIYQALFPHFSKLFKEDRERALKQFKLLFRITMVVTFLISLILSLTSQFWLLSLIGIQYSESIIIFSLLSWVIFSSWGNYTLGIQGMVNLGYKETYSKMVMFFALLHIIILSISINIWGVVSVPIVWFLTESMIFATEYIFLRKKEIMV